VIVFDLRCAGGHVFEAWFGSTDDYDAQRDRSLVSCPMCGDAEVAKAVTAARIGRKGGGDGAQALIPSEAKAMLRQLAEQQQRMLASSEDVGRRFAAEARAIHLGDAAHRTIHGLASVAEARELLEEGVPVAPLPLPVIEPHQKN
jgi:hypothetical protein